MNRDEQVAHPSVTAFYAAMQQLAHGDRAAFDARLDQAAEAVIARARACAECEKLDPLFAPRERADHVIETHCGDCGAGPLRGRAWVVHLAGHEGREAETPADRLRRAEFEDRAAVQAFAGGTYDAAKPAIGAAITWFAGGHPTLILRAGSGVGKTWAAALVIADEGGTYLGAEELPHPMRQDREDHLCVAAGVLVIDDLGTEIDHHGYGAGRLNVITKRRHARGLRTMITTQLQLGCATSCGGRCVRCRYGERVWSRARRGEVRGPDLRAAPSP